MKSKMPFLIVTSRNGDLFIIRIWQINDYKGKSDTLKRLPKKSDTLKRLQNQRVTLKRLHRKKVTPLNDLIFGEFLLNDKNAPVFEPVIKWQSSKNGLNTGYFDTFKKCELLSIALMISKSSLYSGYNPTPLHRFADNCATNDDHIFLETQ